MVYIRFENEEKKKILDQLKIRIDDYKFGLIPYQKLASAVDSFNASRTQGEKVYLHQIIEENMICMEAHKEALEREEVQNNPQVLRQRAEREARIEEKKYQDKMNKEKAKNQGLFGGDLKEMEKSVSFGVSFIFTFFLSGVSGYYAGKLIFGLNEGMSMILAVVALIGTLIIESFLFILKTWKNDKIELRRNQEKKEIKLRAQKTQTSEISKLMQEYQNNKEKNQQEKKND